MDADKEDGHQPASLRRMSVRVRVRPKIAPGQSCSLPPSERCFRVRGRLRVVEGTKAVRLLGGFALLADPCSTPSYRLLTGPGRLEGGQLWSTVGGGGEGGELEISCSLGPSLVLEVQLLAAPQLPQPRTLARTLLLPKPSYSEGDWLYGGVITVTAASHWKIQTSPSATLPLNVTIQESPFPSSFINATNLLIRLTWTRPGTFGGKLVPVKFNLTVGAPENGNITKVIGRLTVECCGVSVHYPESGVVGPTPYSRVASPRTPPPPSPRLVFSVGGVYLGPLALTPQAGILYLGPQAATHLPLQPRSGVLVEWWSGAAVAGSAWVWLDWTGAAATCGSGSADGLPVPVCSTLRSRTQCKQTCGLGASPLEGGRCGWRGEAGGDPRMSANYSTCSADLVTCPDGVCDPLEDSHINLCPQDCTRDEVILGHRRAGNGSRGIGSGSGICSCDLVGKCHCGPKSPKVSRASPSPRPRAREVAGLSASASASASATAPAAGCDSSCVVLILASGLCLVVLLALAALGFASKGWWRRKKEASGGYSTDALLPLPPQEHSASTRLQAEREVEVEVDPKWEVPRSCIKILGLLGEGEFARVLRASASNLPRLPPGSVTVAVKTVKENAAEGEVADLLSEYQLLKEVSHPNVIRLLGACTSPGQPIYLIIEYCALGSLRNYLRKSRNLKPDEGTSGEQIHVTLHDMLSFSWQIAKGMAYLTEIKLVHRDLAARNILLASGKLCKISDFGLTRDVYEDDTYLKRSRGRVPVKWMAVESLSDHVYTSKSDVWSFGVVLWEIVSLGSSPYPGIAAHSLFQLLKSGHRMAAPSNCPPHLYEIMQSCWSEDPTLRPSFEELVRVFERELEQGSDYLECGPPRLVSNPAYFTPRSSDLQDITFRMDLEEEEPKGVDEASGGYENEKASTSFAAYDVPKQALTLVVQ